MSKEKECRCCKRIWYEDMLDKKFKLCPNCYEYCKPLIDDLKIKDKQIADLEAKLAIYEKDDFEDLYYKSIEQRKDLEAKLAESEKEIEKLNVCVKFYKSYYISFKGKVIDELEKVKRYIDDKAYYLEEENFGIEINEYIDNQINELKGKVE